MTSLLVVYEESCRNSQVQPNSALSHFFAATNSAEPLQVLALDTNIIGPRGLGALLPVWHVCRHTLHTLDLSYNSLDNAAVRHLAQWLLSSSRGDGVPALRRLELRGNLFTYQTGKCLVPVCDGLRPVRGMSPPRKDGEADDSRCISRDGPRLSTESQHPGLAGKKTSLADDVDDDGSQRSRHPSSHHHHQQQKQQEVLWEEMWGLQLDYVGVADTLMPPALQEALRQRLEAAIVRRNARRRIPPHDTHRHSQVSAPPSLPSYPHEKQQPRESVGGCEAGKSGGDPVNVAFTERHGEGAPQGRVAAPLHSPADLFDQLSDDEVDNNMEKQNNNDNGNSSHGGGDGNSSEALRVPADAVFSPADVVVRDAGVGGEPPMKPTFVAAPLSSLSELFEAAEDANNAVAATDGGDDGHGVAAATSGEDEDGEMKHAAVQRRSRSTSRLRSSGPIASVDASRADTMHTALPLASITDSLAAAATAVEEEEEEGEEEEKAAVGSNVATASVVPVQQQSMFAPAGSLTDSTSSKSLSVRDQRAHTEQTVEEHNTTALAETEVSTPAPFASSPPSAQLVGQQLTEALVDEQVVIEPPTPMEPAMRKTAEDILEELQLQVPQAEAGAQDDGAPSWLDEM